MQAIFNWWLSLKAREEKLVLLSRALVESVRVRRTVGIANSVAEVGKVLGKSGIDTNSIQPNR